MLADGHVQRKHLREELCRLKLFVAEQRLHLVDVPAGVPQRIDERVLRPIGDVVEQGGNFGASECAGHGAQRERPPVVGEPAPPMSGDLTWGSDISLRFYQATLHEFYRGRALILSQNSRSDVLS